jgi:hypothetical protein
MPVYTCIYMYANTHIQARAHAHAHTHVYASIYMHLHACAQLHRTKACVSATDAGICTCRFGRIDDRSVQRVRDELVEYAKQRHVFDEDEIFKDPSSVKVCMLKCDYIYIYIYIYVCINLSHSERTCAQITCLRESDHKSTALVRGLDDVNRRQ